ncbi:PHP domain-containing protein [Oxobacter pfennigii]|uniref:PHP domain-containing protein n=1 Tax=Oxobacter pfennigii TaxID=36849 RepID=UPI0006D3CC11|nr:PHP domain-containing protein [Oxobacter pfennigii]
MFVDYHVHLDKLDWNIETINDLTNVAKSKGVDSIGVVVHTKILSGFEPLYSHVFKDGQNHKKLKFDKSIDEYLSLLEYAKKEGYPVLTGLEVCYAPEGEEFLKSKLGEYPYDFLIGSVHLIESRHFKTAVEFYGNTEMVGRMYYERVLKAARSGLFNIIGHIEIARREGIPSLDYYPELLDEICRELVKNNCAVEINTKWLTKRDYLVPDKTTLEYMFNAGVKVVFSSDAHHKGRIGYEKDKAISAIKAAGYESFSIVG